MSSTRLPRKLTELLSSAQIQLVHHVALGFENSFLITWRDKSGNDHIDDHGLPSELRDFLHVRNSQRRLVRDVPKIRCTLGPYNASFFAQDSLACVWMNLPSELATALQSRIKNGKWVDKPRILALGADDNFLLITEKHAAVWDLEYYPTISKLLEYSRQQDHGIKEIQDIVLHAYRYQTAISKSRNGTLIYENIPPHELAGIKSMVKPILEDTKALDWRIWGRDDRDRKREGVRKRPTVLQERAQMRREWSEHSQQFTAQAKGLKLSLSLSVSAVGGFSKLLG